jgi:D-xylose transport system substrate-binding protein
MELSAAQAIVEGKMFGTLWPAPDEMAVRAAKVAVGLARCETPKMEASIDNGAGQVPWAKTPITLVTAKDMPAFVCAHPYWLKADDVYKNVPAKNLAEFADYSFAELLTDTDAHVAWLFTARTTPSGDTSA